MVPKIDSLLYPQAEMNLMREALRRAGMRDVPSNREDRRRLNAVLRKLGAPELQVSKQRTSKRSRPAPEQSRPISLELD